MKLKVKKINRYEIIYITFAFDSLLKINLPFMRMHLGILLMLTLSALSLISFTKITSLRKFVKANWSIMPFFLYQLLIFFFNDHYPGTFKVLLYYFLGLYVFVFTFNHIKYISDFAIVVFQWVMIISGLFQYSLLEFFNYQLTFYNPEHYMMGGSFAIRLRGFFVEPNWYSIVIGFNILLLINRGKRDLLKNKLLIILTILCLALNGSYTFIGIVFIVLVFEYFIRFKKITIKKILLLLLSAFLVIGLLYVRSKMTYNNPDTSTQAVEVNYGSRLFPLVRTVDYMLSQNVFRQIFGYGIGSWPYVGLKNELGYIGMIGEYIISPGRRDSAEIQVFILELGWISIIFLYFDMVYCYFKYRKKSICFAIACAFYASCFLLYPIYNFAMYLVPFYILRTRTVTMGKWSL